MRMLACEDSKVAPKSFKLDHCSHYTKGSRVCLSGMLDFMLSDLKVSRILET
jgi:hypothetical protein